MKYTVFLTSLCLCIFCLILLSRKSSAADHRYEACVPRNCGNGENITYPFYIDGLHESYCGHPGFQLNCSEHSYPTISFSGNDYIVENISYPSRSIRVYNAAVSSTSKGRCLSQIRNTTLPVSEFRYVNVTAGLHLLSNCTEPLSKDLLRYKVVCQGEKSGRLDLAIWYKDKNLQNGLKSCEKNVVAPVELHGDGERIRMGEYEEILRRGFALNWSASNCSRCERYGGRCGFNTTTYSFRCFCPDRPHFWSCKPKRTDSDAGMSKSKLILIAGVSAAAVVIFFVILFAFNKRKYLLGKMQNNKDIELFLKNNENLATRRYNYSDLKKMTNSFIENLGEGGFASVYRGKLPDGRLVAVKILKESKSNGEEFINEVASISRTSHINIVTLLGFCFEGSKRALVYEFMPNGSLEKFVGHNSSIVERQLGWEKMFQIAVGIAQGIEYLHQGCNTRILHFDIKPHNILLDKDFNPKISDFGLARLCPNRSSIVSMLGARGTIGYIAPEIVYRNVGDVSHKSDVYSYGMMILEMAGETKNTDVRVDHSSENYFPDWIYKNLEQNAELDLNNIVNADEHLRTMIIVGLWCIQTNPTTRPSMSQVMEMLEGNMESLQIPPKHYFFLQPRAAINPSISEISLTFSDVH